MKQSLLRLTILALVTGGTVFLGPSTAGAQVAERKVGEATRFALNGAGFGTRINGGDLPAGSDTTAYQAIGCTNRVGKTSSNHVAKATLPDIGKVSEVSSRTWTARHDGVVSANTRASIQRAVLRNGDLGKLVITGLESLVRAYNDGAYKATITTSIASMVYTDATGTEQELAPPTPGEPVLIPGFAKVRAGAHKRKIDSSHAFVAADALRVDLLMSGSRVRLAKSDAEISGGVQRGLFNGQAASLQAKAVDGIVSVGRLPLTLMPCVGTGGEVRTKSNAGVDLGGGIVVEGLNAEQEAHQTMKVAQGYEQGQVASLDLNDGELVVEAVTGRANVRRTQDALHRNIRGTTLGAITSDGTPQEFPDSDVLEIPGVATLERNIVKKVPNGISVIALRITLLDGSGAVIDLGKAKMIIRDSNR